MGFMPVTVRLRPAAVPMAAAVTHPPAPPRTERPAPGCDPGSGVARSGQSPPTCPPLLPRTERPAPDPDPGSDDPGTIRGAELPGNRKRAIGPIAPTNLHRFPGRSAAACPGPDPGTIRGPGGACRDRAGRLWAPDQVRGSNGGWTGEASLVCIVRAGGPGRQYSSISASTNGRRLQSPPASCRRRRDIRPCGPGPHTEKA